MSGAPRLRGNIGPLQYLALGFGTMIGSAWVILLGDWLGEAGPGGAVLGFLAGGVVVMIVGACYAELTGYCNVNDAFHASSLSPEGEGPYLAMTGALRSAGLTASDIGYINAHGTGTENNDASESRAMIRVFGIPPVFSSTKSSIGHTLGASGAIEAVYSILGLSHQEAYAGLNFSSPIPETGLRPLGVYTKMKMEHVLSNSFGFGGNCTSLIFSKVVSA